MATIKTILVLILINALASHGQVSFSIDMGRDQKGVRQILSRPSGNNPFLTLQRAFFKNYITLHGKEDFIFRDTLVEINGDKEISSTQLNYGFVDYRALDNLQFEVDVDEEDGYFEAKIIEVVPNFTGNLKGNKIEVSGKNMEKASLNVDGTSEEFSFLVWTSFDSNTIPELTGYLRSVFEGKQTSIPLLNGRFEESDLTSLHQSMINRDTTSIYFCEINKERMIVKETIYSFEELMMTLVIQVDYNSISHTFNAKITHCGASIPIFDPETLAFKYHKPVMYMVNKRSR